MMKLPPLSQLINDAELWEVLGNNCKMVREDLGMNRETAMHLIWQYNNKQIGNRLVELEKGSKAFSIPLLVKVALVYKTSLDYLVGLSDQSVMNVHDQSNKMIMNAMHDATIDMADMVSSRLSNMMVDMPKYQGEMLNMSAKKAVQAIIDAQMEDMLFKADHPEIIRYADELLEKTADFDKLLGRCRRYVEMKVLQGNHSTTEVHKSPDESDDNLVKFANKDQIWKLIGINCKAARDVAGLSKDEAVKRIWGTGNYRHNYKFLVDMERGSKNFSLITLIKFATVYECSLDFLVGISDEIDKNLVSSQNGLIVQSMRSAALELVDRVSEQLTKMLQHLPNCHGEMLNTISKKLVGSVQKVQHNYVFKEKHSAVLEAVIELNEQVRIFETTIARINRYVEINMIQQIEEYEKVGLRITDRKELTC